MSISINNTESFQANITTGHALLTAKLAQGQQELEGKMALTLLTSAGGGNSAALPAVGVSGHNVNIKV
ncbi:MULTISPECIES: cytoplasmic protein [unclassified Colwellia]|jgi:hypothetical protein|uniref:cytoplasmic protein n=1 Tax=unclassified Colwellia TaxID=196834 RepID=UPI0015F5B101|nr:MULTISPECIES: cytoplasmic protein [unclassified Colwellia]MBA6233696.1 cytoplasmic protein [Colwellia sp. MB02u-7]MBA6237243.1 cytoplasmic protein [Colwellia sp. MB02u-11]MBA6257237.1 cytoplasmic protein [Colwellia sp. MB3u-28]MBA6258822.1 cytoplasmic protein [Colwellia sp. MB3u-41]MBA6300487.1 cytoplasmic protein [Colwellia sp. MB3u-22]